jgi:RNA polymerase sigma factor (sigma-70 family)
VVKQDKKVPGDYRKLADEELIFRYSQKNEHEAINCLFDRYGYLVYGNCLKYLKDTDTAKEATERIFIKLLDDLKRFKIELFKPWLYKQVKNYCHLQSRRLLQVADNEFVTNKAVGFVDASGQTASVIAAAMNKLNDRQHNYLDLFYGQKLTFREIANRTGETTGIVRAAINEGRKILVNEFAIQKSLEYEQ